MSVLVVAEHLRGELRPVAHELVTAARGLSGPTTVAALGANADELAAAANVEGVDEIVTLATGSDALESDVHLAALARLVEERRPHTILAGFTVAAMSWAPALAARLGLGFAADVLAARVEDGTLVAERAVYGGKLRAELDFPGHESVLLLLRPGVWPPTTAPGAATVTATPPPDTPSRARHSGWIDPEPGAVDIAAADFLLAVGRGLADEEPLARLERLAERMGATLAVSRPLVDAGWADGARQVGQSGKTVKPRVYLALGISGAVQHLAGMRGSETVIAVNTDPEAAIFDAADYGAVADLLEVAEELERLY